MKRFFFSFFFICLSFYCVSSFAQDVTFVSVDKFHIQGGVKGTDYWFGFKDSLIVTKLTIVPEHVNIEKPAMDNDQTEYNVFDSCVVYRKYKGQEALKIGVFLGNSIKNNSIEYNDSIAALLGENDNISYDIKLFYKKYTRELNDQEWIVSDTLYENKETKTTGFSIFEKPTIGMINLKNFVYKHGDEINLKINVSGGCEKGWTYRWYSSHNNDVDLSRDDFLDFTCDNDGIELRKDSLYCTVTNYVENFEKGTLETLYSETRVLESPIEIFPAPMFTPQDIHHNNNADDLLYSLYIGQELDIDALKGNSGGIGGYPEGWKYELFVDGNLVECFKPSKSGKYELEYKVSNTAIQTDKTQTTWFEKSFRYTFDVFENPYISDILRYSEKGANFEVFDEKEDLHVVKGTEIQFQLEGIGGCKDSWKTDWTLYRGNMLIDITDINIDNNSFTAKFKTEDFLTKDSIHYLIKYKIYNNPTNHVKGFGETFPFMKEGEKKIVVWRDINTIAPGLKISANNTIYIETYDNENVSLIIDNVGGAPSRWKNSWKSREGSPIGVESNNGEKYKLSNLQSANGKASTYSYTVESKYGAHTDKYNFVVIVWPKPILKDLQLKLNKEGVNIFYNIINNVITPQCYINDLFSLEYIIEGGIIGENRNLWKCIITDEKNSINTHNLDQKNGKISLNATNLTVKFVHKYDNLYNSANDEWLSNSTEYTIVPTKYEQPELVENLKDSSIIAKWGKDTIDVYEGHSINMEYDLHKGYDNGWKLSWKVDGEVHEDTEQHWTYIPQLESGAKKSEEKTIQVTIENRIGDNVGLHEVIEYPIRVWRKADFKVPSIRDRNNPINEIFDETINVREGNELLLNVDPVEYGYIGNASYNYIWNINGNIQNGKDITTCMVMKDVFDSPELRNETQTIKYKAQVCGPYGNVWDSHEQTYNVNVYNKPKTPKDLKKKGSGISSTLICETELTDVELEKYEYYLVYGYVENGINVDFASVKQENPGMVRWALAPSSDVLKKDQLYVYALWKDENVEITSGKRYISREGFTGKEDDDWDGSTYDGSTRTVINNNHTKIDDIASEVLDGIEIVQIYSLDGVAVGKNVEELPGGMYIICYMSNGNEIISRKIIIK